MYLKRYYDLKYKIHMDTEKDLVAIIMAGGLGKRMNSDLPKVLHKIAGIPMICHILSKLNDLHSVKPSVKKVMIVVGKYREIIEETINSFSHLYTQYLDEIQ